MPRRKAAGAASEVDAAPVITQTNGTRVADSSEPLEPVKVNNANLTELKIACDDAVRRFFARPDQFRTRHTHTDVRLGLGWASVVVAGATGYYGWQRDFEEAKPLVTIGVVLYFLLTAIQTAYAYWLEDKTIYVGKRRTLANRIETERLTIESETKPAPTPSTSPQYSVTFSYTRSTGGGKNKTIIRKAQATQDRNYTEFFDTEGTLDEPALIAWLSESSASVVDGKSTTSRNGDSAT